MFGTPSKILTYLSPFLEDKQNNHHPQKRALIILNSPIHKPPSPLFRTLWETSSIRICADGGANRLYEADPQLIPDMVKGDLDSLQEEVKSYYQSRGVKIERDPDQDNNDLSKSLAVLNRNENLRVIIYGAFGGRFDQEMASIQCLYTWGEQFQYNNLLLMDDHTCAFLLPAGIKNEIRIPRYGSTPSKDMVGEGPTCGLIPLGSSCDEVITSGFRWNLDGSTPLKFGGLVSTSNHVEDEVATVETSQPLVFTAEVISGLDRS